MDQKIDQIKTFYREAFQNLNKKSEIPEINVEFYPYIGINHTIRVRGEKVFVRLAEVCREMPLDVQKALAFILVSKLLRKKIAPAVSEKYRGFIKNAELREKALDNKRAKGRKFITTAQGELYNLNEIFAHLNQIYFDGKIPAPTLTWSARKTFRILGHHDAAHETIVISKSLDDAKTPKYVVEFIVFHEMLHIFHPTQYRDGRRYNHTPQFRRDERKFAYFAEAEDWIERNVKRFKKNAQAETK